jgi:hypothetical protein
MISMDYHATRIVNGGTTATVLTSLMLFSGVKLTLPLPPGIQISPACDQNALGDSKGVHCMFRPGPNLLKTQLN